MSKSMQGARLAFLNSEMEEPSFPELSIVYVPISLLKTMNKKISNVSSMKSIPDVLVK